MKTTCLVNNFNYSNFVVEAVNSALNQTVSFDEIIIVDDGSTDQSVQILKEKFLAHDKIKLILKEKNEGQLSCFNEGYLASTGDIIFFLDADDIYKDTYLEEALYFYKKNKECDFLFCPPEIFGNSKGIFLPSQSRLVKKIKSKIVENVSEFYDDDRDLGYSVILTLYHREWIGSATSTLSMRRSVLEKILPIPYLKDWWMDADNCLIYGSSLVEARKFYMAKPLVKYRFHGNNYYMGNSKFKETYIYKKNLKINRLFDFICKKMDYHQDLSDLAHIEFRTIPNPCSKELFSYIKIIALSSMLLPKKLVRLLFVIKYFLSSIKSTEKFT